MINNSDYVYHSSKEQGLKVLEPNTSMHGEKWVYATTSLEMSVVFLSGRGGDLTCQVGRDKETGKVFICERFKDVFEFRYSNTSGSIYLLPSDKFIKGKTDWDEEVVCNEKVKIIEEVKIDNVKNYILNLTKEERIFLVKFPNKIGQIPDDDEDLVFRGIVWSRQFGDDILEDFKKLHPNLLTRIQEGLKEGKYIDGKFDN
ncbi:MAG: hypothetical protein PF638_14375 [Candidatus Delongbacteria bacterium]|jgi:hypothetical protein|nr:hypothetical protein [Candidatus Delongbacteria bacterium]